MKSSGNGIATMTSSLDTMLKVILGAAYQMEPIIMYLLKLPMGLTAPHTGISIFLLEIPAAEISMAVAATWKIPTQTTRGGNLHMAALECRMQTAWSWRK